MTVVELTSVSSAQLPVKTFAIKPQIGNSRCEQRTTLILKVPSLYFL